MATQPGRATTDIDYRITLGAYVNARLQVNPKAFRIPCNNVLDIYIVRDFLDERDCLELIALIDTDNEPSKLLSYNGDQEFRTQQFKPHYDFFHKGEGYWEEMMRSGGQRTWTAMVFLNDVEGGGETNFTNAAAKITPRRGNLLCWNNMDAIGQPNTFAMHQGCPVTAGTKYIITKWYRERPWAYTDVQAY